MYYNEDLDYESLRNDLIDYFGTAMMIVAPAAVVDLSRVERASDEELIQIAKENGFNLNDYKHHGKRF